MNSFGRLLGLRRKGKWQIFFETMLQNALHAFLQGWMLMLGVQVIHNEWVHHLPTIGYWWAVLIVWLLTGTFSRLPKVEPYEEPKR